MAKKKIGWFSFTCCEDSTIIFTELLNSHFDEWKRKIDIRAARFLRTREDLSDLDVSFVEGAIASERDAEKLKKIRKSSKILIAIGQCSCAGMPAGQRNNFNQTQKNEIQLEVERFKLMDKTVPVNKIVKVDEYVYGCPMNEQNFLEVFNKYIK